MVARNDITGDNIATREISNAYRDNWDTIFGAKNKAPAAPEPEQPSAPEMITIRFLVVDYGDGSSGVQFFRTQEAAEALLDNDAYYGNDGEVSSFQIPAGPNTIHFQD